MIRNYFYHPEGSDVNGNGGPSAITSDGWIVIRGETMTEATTQLPEFEQIKVQKFVNDQIEQLQELREYELRHAVMCPVEIAIHEVAGWGMGFTLMDAETFMSALESEVRL